MAKRLWLITVATRRINPKDSATPPRSPLVIRSNPGTKDRKSTRESNLLSIFNVLDDK
ncbi:hypothetical protein GCM10009111_13390 [Colwellia asteriadis]|uniref:Uncharacterized protein n=1 Tax=Colwellia asteriadis TaxID=517723 RepID=A0ABN1L5L5_9GAMM